MSTRRDFLKSFGLGAVMAGMRSAECTAETEKTKGTLPTIRLGKLEVSRLILGSNPFFGFDHGNPQGSGDEMREYYTEERVMAMMDHAAEHGITAVWTPCYENWIHLWNRYREKDGKLKVWIAQPDRLPMEREIKVAVKNGSKAIAIQGICIDDQVNDGKWDVVRGWLELIKSHGLPAGMATHRATTHLYAEEHGLPADFYHQCLYRPDNYVREGLEESLATIEKLPKPVVAYKVLAAGRVLPKDRLPYVFKHLKPKDGICLGVFPKKRDEIAENSSLTLKLTRRVPRQSDLQITA